jgi:hypothetical protein
MKPFEEAPSSLVGFLSSRKRGGIPPHVRYFLRGFPARGTLYAVVIVVEYQGVRRILLRFGAEGDDDDEAAGSGSFLRALLRCGGRVMGA